MKFLKITAVIAVILAVFAPGTLTEIKVAATAAASSFVSSASAADDNVQDPIGKGYADRDAHGLACTLFRKWSKADAQTRASAAKTVGAVARLAAGKTDDPAAKALLAVVPAAVGHGASVPSHSAQMLLERECRSK